MKLAVLKLVSPDPKVIGYARRFMSEFTTGFLVGSIDKSLAKELVDVLVANNANGCFILASNSQECGFEVPYFNLNHRAILNFDGIPLVEIRQAQQSLK